jgi:TatD DNase family protein
MNRKLIDTHAHFDLCMKDAGYTEEFLFGEMKSAGVELAVQISTESADFVWCADFAARHENILYTLGIHPGSSWCEEDMRFLSDMLDDLRDKPARKKLFGIGEIGLDYYWDKENRDRQMMLFERQARLAKAHDLPVVIHSRDAHEDTYSALKRLSLNCGILHCFSGGVESARQYLNLGFYISFAGNVTYKKALNLQEAASFIPDDRLLLETDCPYLSPQAVRGQKNHPAWVSHTYQFVAGLRSSSVDVLAETIHHNFTTLAGI